MTSDNNILKRYKRLTVLLLLLPLACGLGSAETEPALETPTSGPVVAVTVTTPATQPVIPTATPVAALPAPTPEPGQPAAPTTSEPGRVTGAICFPSEVIPPLTLYFQNMATQAITQLATTNNQTSYTIDLPPGEYIAYAWLPDASLSGAYSPAVPCGLSVDCTEHQPLPFQVTPGQTIEGIDICDWYGQPSDIPSPPDSAQAPVASVEPDVAQAAAPGAVAGSICYPSSRTPPMTLYLENSVTGAVTEVDIAQDQTTYAVDLPPGDYIAYAQTTGTELAGFYSQAVPCGLGPACTDHRPLPFQVNRGQITTGIDLCDWYNPPGVVSADLGAGATGGVVVTTLQNMHVFAGPGLNYPQAGLAPARASAPAVGRNSDGSWLQIENPTGDGEAWIYAPLLQMTGNWEILPMAATPAEALPPTEPLPLLAPAKDQFIPADWSTAYNDGIVHFKGSIRDEAGRPVNGFSVLADNGTWSVLSHPTGASHHYPDTADGAWDIVVSNATDAVGWWTLTVVRYDCPDFEGGFNAQCKQFTRLSENQVVKVIYPDGAVINADWVCQRDCDKGLYVEGYRP